MPAPIIKNLGFASVAGSTNKFVGKTENLLGKQKSFVSSISTISLVNITIFFLRAAPK